MAREEVAGLGERSFMQRGAASVAAPITLLWRWSTASLMCPSANA